MQNAAGCSVCALALTRTRTRARARARTRTRPPQQSITASGSTSICPPSIRRTPFHPPPLVQAWCVVWRFFVCSSGRVRAPTRTPRTHSTSASVPNTTQPFSAHPATPGSREIASCGGTRPPNTGPSQSARSAAKEISGSERTARTTTLQVTTLTALEQHSVAGSIIAIFSRFLLLPPRAVAVFLFQLTAWDPQRPHRILSKTTSSPNEKRLPNKRMPRRPFTTAGGFMEYLLLGTMFREATQ